jgi:transcriptional regulator with XRE-family HTH domain
MFNLDILTKRLKTAIEESGLSVRKIAKKAGIHEVSLYRYLNGERKLNNIDIIYKISKALETNMNTFFKDFNAYEENSLSDVCVIYGDEEYINNKYNSYIKLPLMECKVGAYPGIIEIADDKVDGWVCIDAKNLPKNISERCYAFRVKGDSMQPYLCDNDLVAILPYPKQPSLETIIKTNVYLVKIPDGFGSYGLSIKHIHVVDDKTVELVSDNKQYPPLTINLEDTDFRIMGRVVWMWREM